MENKLNDELFELEDSTEEKTISLEEELGMSTDELFTRVDNNEAQAEKISAPRYSYWKSVFRVFFKNKVNIVVLVILLLILLISFVYPLFINFDQMANVTKYDMQHLTPGAAISKYGFSIKWIWGTGKYGESLFEATWVGSRLSLELAFVCAAINMTIGVIIGAVWGYSKKFATVMQEIYNILGNIPYILLISVLVLVVGASFWSYVFALCVTGWLGVAYFIRTQVIIIRDREYNLASRCLGTPLYRVTTKNILPFLTSVIVTLLAQEIPSYISYEVYLSYLGFGLSGLTLGKLIQQGEESMFIASRAFEFWIPVAVASVITIVLYIIGQNLGDASDPRTHM